MILCVMFNAAAPAAGGPPMAAGRGATAQDEKNSPTRTTARNPNMRSFIVTFSIVAIGKRLKAARRESCRNIRYSESRIVSAFKPSRAPESSDSLSRTITHRRSLAHRFSRNLAPDFMQYLSERPEMNSQEESSRKANQRERRTKWHRKKRRK